MEKIPIKINMDEIHPLTIPLRELRRKQDNFSLRRVYREQVIVDD